MNTNGDESAVGEARLGNRIPGHCVVNAGVAAVDRKRPSHSLFVRVRVRSWFNSLVPVE